MNQNLAVMAAFADMGEGRPFVVYTGYSQGADALGDAAENPRTYDNDFFVPGKDMVVLVSDPRSPWGIKAWLDTMPWLKPIVEAAGGIDPNGARDPEATKIKVVSVIIVGDPRQQLPMGVVPADRFAHRQRGRLPHHPLGYRTAYVRRGRASG